MKYAIAAVYIICIIIANFTAGTVISLWFLSFALGTLFFGPIFTLRDSLHKLGGKQFAITVIGIAVLINVIVSLTGGFPLRIVIASTIALALSELVDTEIYHRLMARDWKFRVLRSNIVSIPLDTALFTLIAFYGIWPASLMAVVILTDIGIKWVMATAVMYAKYNFSYS